MKKIGIIGGLGPESTIDYYRLIIDSSQKAQINENYPEMIIYSLNINEVSDMMEAEQWDKLIDLLANAIKLISKAEADFAVIAANTPHIVFDEVKTLSPIPMLSIVEETCKVIKTLDLKKVGLDEFGIPFLNTSKIHAESAVKYCLSET
ncbi:MAG: aspartate/glutamate racemase family protein [candidate division WOR-3 bacterium]|nr:aspartate/glutamate racemase family protein [candidate division WOR-3 bacterium]